MTNPKLTELKCTCYACPAQYEGKTESGDEVYARERHGYCRVEVNDNIIYESHNDEYDGENPLDVIYRLFDVQCEVE